MKTLIVSNKEINDIMKTVKFFEESGLLIKEFIETIKNETKERKGGFLDTLLGTLGASLLENMFVCKGVIQAGEGTRRVCEDF